MRPRSALLLAAGLVTALAIAWPSRAQPGATDEAYALGYSAAVGQAGVPWQRSNAYLNQPWGLGGDRDGVWIANGAGRNLVRFGTGAAEDLGRAGTLDALYGQPVRFLADVAVISEGGEPGGGGGGGGNPSPQPTPTKGISPRPLERDAQPEQQRPTPTSPSGGGQTGRRHVWFVDSGGHVAVGLTVEANGAVTVARVLGETDVAGSDATHLKGPTGIARDAAGNVYVADTGNHRVQVLAADGRLQATIGQAGTAGAGPGQLNQPARLALAANRLYIADAGNHRVVAYDVTSPAAPREVQAYGRAGAPGRGNDQLYTPLGLHVDATFLYVADTGNDRVQVLEWRTGTWRRTLDGTTTAGCAGTGGAWTAPSDVAQDTSGNVYVALPTRMLVVGCDAATWAGRADLTHGAPDTPYLTKDSLHNAPAAVALAPDGSVAVIEGEGQRVVRLAADGTVRWVAGRAGVAGTGSPTALRFDAPADAAFLPDGRLVVADSGNGRLVVLGDDGSQAAIWGAGRLVRPEGLALLADGSLAVADAGTGRVTRLDAAGTVGADLAGPGGALAFAEPVDVAPRPGGGWLVSERAAHAVALLDATGRRVGTLGEAGVSGSDYGHLDRPRGLAVDGSGRVYVADSGNDRVMVFDSGGGFSTVLGGARRDGTGGMIEPAGLALGPDGRAWVADTYNHRVLAFAPAAEPWLPAAKHGFGTRAAPAVEALAEWDGRLLAGVRHGAGAEVWRREGAGPWVPATTGGFGDPANQAVIGFQTFGNRIYAGVENVTETFDPTTGVLASETSSGGSVWRSTDGQRWDAVASGGLGDAAQSGLGPFAVFGGRLYAGTRTVDRAKPPALWRSATGDSGSWQASRVDLASRDQWPKNGAISALASYSNTLYVGTCAQDKAQIWASLDGAAWRAAGTLEPGADPKDAVPQLSPANVPCVTAFAEYDGHLYAALGTEPRLGRRLNRPSGPPVELWRCVKCDGTDWDTAAGGGFGNSQNRGLVALATYDEPPFRYLYAFAGNTMNGLEAWRASDGLDWGNVADGGFGDDNNADPAAAGAARVYQNRLYVGTLNTAQGGELWSSGGTRPGVVPTPSGPTATPTSRPNPQPPTGRARYHKAAEWPLSESAPEDVLAGPVDMAVAADGETYLLNGGQGRVSRLLADGTWAPTFGGTGSGRDRITMSGALAVDDAAGRVYVADLGTERVMAYDREGVYIGQVVNEAYVVDIAVRTDGSLWLADRLAGGVRRVQPDGTELERFGQYGPQDEDGFTILAAVAEEPGGRLWIADLGGMRLRAYDRNAGGALVRSRTVDMTDPLYQRNGCTGARLQVLAANVLLAGPCILEDGRFREGLPANHRSSDLYGVDLRTANPAAGQFRALATYDVDRDDPANDTLPAVVAYFDEGFDIVTDYWLGRPFTPNTADGNAVVDPARIDALPGGDLALADARAFSGFPPPPPPFIRRMSPAGESLEQLSLATYPSRHYRVVMYGNFAVSTGEPGRVMGLANLVQGRGTNFQVLTYAQEVRRRHCTAGTCRWYNFIEPIWQTSLVNLNQGRGPQDYNYAATFDHVKKQYVLLQLWADNPVDAAMPSRLYLFPVEQRGRKTEVALEGTERQALWTDVDAGPDGKLYVLDTLNDRVAVLDGAGTQLAMVNTPKDAWKLAGGPNGEIFILTNYGHVVRMSSDGTILSRFVALPNDIAPPVAQRDLAVDEWGRVYVIDNLYDLVTVFEPEGTEDDVLEGGRCSLGGDKWVAPGEILLGETAELFLSLFGTCGFVEDAADIVLAINTSQGQELNNLRVTRQIFSVVDLDRHRVGIVSYITSSKVEQRLTQNRQDLIRAMYDLTGSRPTCGGANNESALRGARDVFRDSPAGKRKVLVIIQPGDEPPPGVCAWSDESIARTAAELKGEGVTILAVNGPSVAASSEVLSDIAVAARGQGVGRPAIRRALSRTWPDALVRTGSLVDTLPANIDYVDGSARPPALWDAAARTLTWTLADLPLGEVPRFQLTIRPRAEGLWPTNVQAVAEVMDGWGANQKVTLPIPKIRVYGELPPTPTFTPTRTPTPTVTPTPEPTSTPRPTAVPEPIFLPLLLRTELCQPDTRNADVALVIDTSGSMSETTSPGGPTKLAAAQNAARQFLAQLKQGRDQAALVQFNNAATVVVGLTPDIPSVTAGLAGLTQAAGTRIDLALDAAAAELSGPARRRENNAVLILLTDGAPSGTTPDAVRAAAERAKGTGALVYTIGLGQGLDAALMADIASRPDWYYPAPDTADLAAIYDRIVEEIPCKPQWPSNPVANTRIGGR